MARSKSPAWCSVCAALNSASIVIRPLCDCFDAACAQKKTSAAMSISGDLHSMTTDERVSTGRQLLAAGRAGDAAQVFEDMVRHSAGSAEVHFGLADSMLALGRFDRAIDCYRQSLALRPDALANARLGIALCQAGRIGDAVPVFEAALALDPELLDARINLGMSRSHLGDRIAGVRALREAVALKPDHADAWVVWSTAAFADGRLAEAETTTARALALVAHQVTALSLRSL